MSDLLLNVRQIAQYPTRTASDGTETLLLQTGGVGGPYQSITATRFVSTALNGASIGIGYPLPGDAAPGTILGQHVTLPLSGDIFWNAYLAQGTNGDQTFHRWQPGLAAGFAYFPSDGFWWGQAPGGVGGAPTGFTPLMVLSPAGMLTLPSGTILLARDPSQPMEAATRNWVTNNTVGMLNGRRGQVWLGREDIYGALGLDEPLATQQDIQDRIQEFVASYPLVTAWNGRIGSVWLTLADVMSTFFEPGARPIAPTPPPTDASARIATTEWVARFAYEKFWIDLLGIFAPLNSPVFTGNPTAPTPDLDDASNSLATTDWVRNFVEEIAAGVASFNNRTGYVTLLLSDVNAVNTAPGAQPLANTPPATAINGEIVTANWVNTNSQRLTHIATAAPTAHNTGDFWYNPTSRRLAVWTGTAWAAAGAPGVTVSDTAPVAPWQGDQWFDSSTGALMLCYDATAPGLWIQVGG